MQIWLLNLVLQLVTVNYNFCFFKYSTHGVPFIGHILCYYAGKLKNAILYSNFSVFKPQLN